MRPRPTGLCASEEIGVECHLSTKVVPQTVVTDIVDAPWLGHDKEWR